MENILTILLSATGGALISALVGFLNTVLTNKNSFKIVKEKDKYEYVQYKNRILYKYLEEIERECILLTSADEGETLRDALLKRNSVRSIYNLSRPFFNEASLQTLFELYTFESDAINDEDLKTYFLNGGTQGMDRDKIDELLPKTNDWLSKLTDLRDGLIEAIIEELIEIKNSRTK